VEPSYERRDALVRTISNATVEPLVAFLDSLIEQQFAVGYVRQPHVEAGGSGQGYHLTARRSGIGRMTDCWRS
jgi:hypothetical protein